MSKSFFQRKARIRKDKSYPIPGELVGTGRVDPMVPSNLKKTHYIEHDVNILEYDFNLKATTLPGRGERPHFKGQVTGRIGEVYKVHAWLNDNGQIRIEILK